VKALAGLRAFLAVVQEPGYRRIVIQEGPAVLGYERRSDWLIALAQELRAMDRGDGKGR